MASVNDVYDILEPFGGQNANDLNVKIYNTAEDDTKYEVPNIGNSAYLDLGDLQNYLENHRSEFTILNLNIQSINSKFNSLYSILADLAEDGLYFSVICLQESWLSVDADVSLFSIPNYQTFHQGRSRCSNHGGLLTYVHTDFTASVRKSCRTSSIWEGLFIDLIGENLLKPITIGNLYRPPRDNNNNLNIESFIGELTPIVHKIGKECAYALILGDFNIDLLQINEREKFSDFFDMLCTNSFYPRVTLPTRFANRSCSLIDHVYCKLPLPADAVSSRIVVTQLSDHLPCIISIKTLQSKHRHPKFVTIRTNSREAIAKFKNEIEISNLSRRLNPNLMTDPNLTYIILEDAILSARDKHMPKRNVRFNKYKHKMNKWVTTGILKSIRYRDSLYKKLKSTPYNCEQHMTLKLNLKTYNYILNKTIRTAKKEYYFTEFSKYKHDIRKTWDTIKEAICKNKTKSMLPSYLYNKGIIYSNNHAIADKLNEYFTEVGPELAKSIPRPQNPNSSFNTYLGSPCSSIFTFEYTNPDKISKHIQSLKTKSSAGHDGISSKLLKELVNIISPALSVIINQSLCTGIFPSRLKIGKVLPLFKKGDQFSFENYRPISLLTSISKIFEKVVFDQLYEYFTLNKLLYNSQYGYRKEHSTEFAALELTDKLMKGIDERKIPLSIFLDLSKAFDTLDHKNLLSKLQHYGIHNTSLKWFHSYLTDRKQYV